MIHVNEVRDAMKREENLGFIIKDRIIIIIFWLVKDGILNDFKLKYIILYELKFKLFRQKSLYKQFSGYIKLI